MANAICNACGASVHWYAGRGRRLEELRHRDCGGTLRGMTTGRPGNKTPFHRCALCGAPTRRRAWTDMETIDYRQDSTGARRPLPKGTPLCHGKGDRHRGIGVLEPRG